MSQPANQITVDQRENRKEASKTYLEQTKLLTTLASTFIVAPAVLFKDMVSANHRCVIIMEACFVLSVLSGYITIATMAGSQDEGKFDVFRPATRIASIAQLSLYLIGLGILINVYVAYNPPDKPTLENKVNTRDTIWVKPDTIPVKFFQPSFKASQRHFKKKMQIIDTCCKCNK